MMGRLCVWVLSGPQCREGKFAAKTGLFQAISGVWCIRVAGPMHGNEPDDSRFTLFKALFSHDFGVWAYLTRENETHSCES